MDMSFRRRLGISALAGAVVVLPFVVLEVVNRRAFGEGFPIVLFALLWALSTAFAALLRPIAKHRRPLGLIAGIAALVLIAYAWGAIVADQMPCLLGVPNCD